MPGPLRLFDSYCILGRHHGLGPGDPHTAEDLLAAMDRCGIAEALVVDSLARECSVLEGNVRALEARRLSPRLHPAWVAVPPGITDEQPAPKELLRRMQANQVGALFLYPAQYAFNLADWSIDELLEPLAALSVPVFIVPNDSGAGLPPCDQTNWSEVVELCRRFPTLPVVVSEGRIRRSQRLAYRALEACENLRLELSGWWLHHGIEYITRRWGPKRLIFGSNWPMWGQAMTVAALTGADIDDDDKARIAGGNLRELLGWCRPEQPSVEIPPPEDEFVEYGRTGRRPKGMTVLDCHAHYGNISLYHVPNNSLEEVVAEMDRTGVHKALLFSLGGILNDEVYGNDRVAEALGARPDRFVGLTLLNPRRGRDAMLAELERCSRLGFRGVKLIPDYQGYPREGKLIDVACQWAHERREIILNHHWGSPAQVERLVSTYPGACFITGHATDAYAEIIKKHKNLYVCTCALHRPGSCEKLVKAIGADRLLFGSDMLDLPIPWGLGPVLFADLTPQQKRLILGENLRRVLSEYALAP